MLAAGLHTTEQCCSEQRIMHILRLKAESWLKVTEEDY